MESAKKRKQRETLKQLADANQMSYQTPTKRKTTTMMLTSHLLRQDCFDGRYTFTGVRVTHAGFNRDKRVRIRVRVVFSVKTGIDNS